MTIASIQIVNRQALEETKNVTNILKYLDFIERCKLRLLGKQWDKAIKLAAAWHSVDLRWINPNSNYFLELKKHRQSVNSLKLSLDYTNSKGYNVISFDYNGLLDNFSNIKRLEVSMLNNNVVISFVNPSVRYYIDATPPNSSLLSTLIIDANITVEQLTHLKIKRLDFLVLTRIIATNVDDISLLSEFIASLEGLQVLQLSIIHSFNSAINTSGVNRSDSVFSADLNYNSMRRIERIKALTGGEDFFPGDEFIQALLDSHANTLVCFYASDLEISYECYSKALPKFTKLQSWNLPGWTAFSLL